MKIYFPYWKLYLCALSSSILVLLFCISHLNSRVLFLSQTQFTVANYVFNNWQFHIQQSTIDVYNGSARDSCEGKRIFIYDLPPRFNSLLLRNCSGQIVPWLNFCRHAENYGLGRAVVNKTGWHATDVFMAEVFFHRRMIEYPCVAAEQDEADAFYVPYYSGLDALRFLYGAERHRAAEHGQEVAEWLDKNGGPAWRRRGGADHFMVTGRTSWDLCRPLTESVGWGTSLLELEAMANVTVLSVERRVWIPREQAVPYLTSFHPHSAADLREWTNQVRITRRIFLFAFVGAERKEVGLRQTVIQQCKNASSNSSRCYFLDCREMKCTHKPIPIMRKLLKAEFCLQPPGDSPTRRSTFDGLIAGCIPVFFRNDSAYEQYTWHLPADPDAYSVFIPEETVVQESVRIEDALKAYSNKKKREMRDNIARMIPRLLYMNFGAAAASSSSSSSDVVEFKDAFDISVEGVLSRARQISQ